MVAAVLGALGQVGIDLGLRGDPCTRPRLSKVAVGIVEDFSDAAFRAGSLDQDQPRAPFPAPRCQSNNRWGGGSMRPARSGQTGLHR
jgi:hypothetical protein